MWIFIRSEGPDTGYARCISVRHGWKMPPGCTMRKEPQCFCKHGREAIMRRLACARLAVTPTFAARAVTSRAAKHPLEKVNKNNNELESALCGDCIVPLWPSQGSALAWREKTGTVPGPDAVRLTPATASKMTTTPSSAIRGISVAGMYLFERDRLGEPLVSTFDHSIWRNNIGPSHSPTSCAQH